jgi:hypothetical protein
MKQVIKNYTFDATAKTVTLTDFSTILLERLSLIVDTTTNTILYNFADSSVATATVATNVVTLSTVGSAASSDKLQIVYDVLAADPQYDASREVIGTAGALNVDAFSIDVSAYRWASLQVSGTYVGTMTFQGSNDNSAWFNVSWANSNNVIANSGLIQSTVVGSGATTALVHGGLHFRYFRVRMTAYTSGTATITAEFFQHSGYSLLGNQFVVGAAAEAGAATGNPLRVGGWDGTNLRTLKTDTTGNLLTKDAVASAAALTNVSGSATSVSLLASNTSRRSVILHNDSSAILYLKYGTTASTTSFTALIPANTAWTMPVPAYTGAIDGIWASATGSARITELT